MRFPALTIAVVLLNIWGFAQLQSRATAKTPTTRPPMLSSWELRTLRDRCAPDAPMSVLNSIVLAESSGYPNAINIDFPVRLLRRLGINGDQIRFVRQPLSAAEATAWAAYLGRRGVSVALGLMQVSTRDPHAARYRPAQLLDPCTNVLVGWQIFRDHYRIAMQEFGPGQEALHHAISRYNSGNDYEGISNGYLNRVVSALRRSTPEPE